MEKNSNKSMFNIASNSLLFIGLILMVVTVWLENYYLSVGTVVVCAVSLLITILGAEGPKFKGMWKEINLYFFVVCIVLSLSVTLASKMLFYIGIVLFILVIFLYFIPMFVTEKEETKKTKK